MNPVELYQIRSDPSVARTFVEYHVGKEIMTPENMYDGKVVESLARGKQLRLQCVQNDFAVEGRPLNFQTPVGYNGVVQIVEKVLFPPPTMSIEDFIRKNDSYRYSIRLFNVDTNHYLNKICIISSSRSVHIFLLYIQKSS